MMPIGEFYKVLHELGARPLRHTAAKLSEEYLALLEPKQRIAEISKAFRCVRMWTFVPHGDPDDYRLEFPVEDPDPTENEFDWEPTTGGRTFGYSVRQVNQKLYWLYDDFLPRVFHLLPRGNPYLLEVCGKDASDAEVEAMRNVFRDMDREIDDDLGYVPKPEDDANKIGFDLNGDKNGKVHKLLKPEPDEQG